MMYSPTAWDFALLGALGVWFAVDPLLAGRFKAAIESKAQPWARLLLYWYDIAITWGFTLAVFALWVAFGRPWSALWLGAPNALRLGAGLSVAGAHLWYLLRSRGRIFAKPDKFARYRDMFDSVSLLAARTPQERRVFTFVAVTAGIGEEVIMRGFVLWLFASMFGLWIGALANIVLFAFGHAYQGRAGIIRTGVFGAFLTVVVIASGSLLPAVLIHAFQDLIAGSIVSRVFSQAPSAHPERDRDAECATAPA